MIQPERKPGVLDSAVKRGRHDDHLGVQLSEAGVSAGTTNIDSRRWAAASGFPRFQYEVLAGKEH